MNKKDLEEFLVNSHIAIDMIWGNFAPEEDLVLDGVRYPARSTREAIIDHSRIAGSFVRAEASILTVLRTNNVVEAKVFPLMGPNIATTAHGVAAQYIEAYSATLYRWCDRNNPELQSMDEDEICREAPTLFGTERPRFYNDIIDMDEAFRLGCRMEAERILVESEFGSDDEKYTYSMDDLRFMCGVEDNRTIHNHMDAVGVKKPRRGQRNWRCRRNQACQIVQRVAEFGSTQDQRDTAKSSLKEYKLQT